MPECWGRISAQKEHNFSQTHICLALENGVLKHVDGVHRLLAYVLFERSGSSYLRSGLYSVASAMFRRLFMCSSLDLI
jgi:hypothetical protein